MAANSAILHQAMTINWTKITATIILHSGFLLKDRDRISSVMQVSAWKKACRLLPAAPAPPTAAASLAPPPPPPKAEPENDVYAELMKLGELKEKGIITEEEFAKMKKDIIDKF